MIIDKKMELWIDALRKENETLRREKELLIENSERLDLWVMGFYSLCVCDCNNDTNKMRIERDRKRHEALMKQVKGE